MPTGLRAFDTVRWGTDPVAATKGLGYGESCEVAVELGFDLVAGPFSNAQPSMPATQPVWEHIREGILDGLRDAGPVDLVWLCMHGAQMSDRVDDCEGELLSMVREIVGDDAAVGVLLDLHANVTSTMLDAADLVVTCREYPHVDYGQRATEMLPLLARIRSGAVRPTTAAIRFLAPGAYPTTEEPMRSFVERFTATQRRPGVLMVGPWHGFEGSDHPDMSTGVVVTTDGDLALAERIAHEVATDFLGVITSQSWIGPGVEESVRTALAAATWPVVLADRADNAGGGASSDSTFVLAELLRRGATDVALALLWDPAAVHMCHDAGVGARLPLRIGGKCGPMSGDPLDVDAEVVSIRTEAKQAMFGRGEPAMPLGRTAVVRVGGIEVVMNTQRQQVFSRHVFTEHGIDPTARRIVVVKSTQHFHEDFSTFAAHIVRCDGPGTLTADLSTLPFRRARRPILGVDPVDTVPLEAMPAVRARHRSRR